MKYIFNFCFTSFILDYFNLSIDINIMIFDSKFGVFHLTSILWKINPSCPEGGGGVALKHTITIV